MSVIMQPKKFKYKTTLFTLERGGVFAGFPFDGVKEFGKRGAVRINCWIDGVHKQGSLLPMGDGTHAFHVKQDIREAIRKSIGDEVEMVVEQDLSKRVITIPEDWQWLMDDDPELKQKYSALAFSYREWIIFYINQAKLPETRARRIEQMINRIKAGFRGGQKD